MSERDRLVIDASAILGVTPSRTAPGCTTDIAERGREKHDPTLTDVPGFGRVLIAEGDGLFSISIGEGPDDGDPALLIADRGSPERPPLGLYYCPNAQMLRSIGAFCLAAADRLDGGKGKQ